MQSASSQRRITVFDKKNVPIVVTDFGTFFVGCTPDTVDSEMLPFLADSTDAVFTMPSTWTLAHLCNRLGMFHSVTQAKKNGKGDIPIGFSQYVVKVSHVRGVITVYKENIA